MTKEDQFVPHLIVSDGPAALEFYKDVFDAELGDNMMSPEGNKLMHGEIVLDGQKFFVSDWFAPTDGGSLQSPEQLGGTCIRITAMVDNADAVMGKFVARGSTVLMPVQDMFWGARYGKVRDPYGHEWGINQQLHDLSADETQANADEFFQSQDRES